MFSDHYSEPFLDNQCRCFVRKWGTSKTEIIAKIGLTALKNFKHTQPATERASRCENVKSKALSYPLSSGFDRPSP